MTVKINLSLDKKLRGRFFVFFNQTTHRIYPLSNYPNLQLSCLSN